MALNITDVSRLTASSDTAPPDPKKLAEAAREFEAMWIEQMLHSARPSDDSTLSGEPDSTRDMVLDLADQQVARMLASQGGLGLARLASQIAKPRES